GAFLAAFFADFLAVLRAFLAALRAYLSAAFLRPPPIPMPERTTVRRGRFFFVARLAAARLRTGPVARGAGVVCCVALSLSVPSNCARDMSEPRKSTASSRAPRNTAPATRARRNDTLRSTQPRKLAPCRLQSSNR